MIQHLRNKRIHLNEIFCNFVLYNSLSISDKKSKNMSTILLGFIGPWQIGLIVAVVLLLFGGKKIPQLMKGIGSGIKEFKDGIKEGEDAAKSDDKEADKLS